MKSHEADEFKPCACLDENTRREDGMGKPLCNSKKEGGREAQSFHTAPIPEGGRLCMMLVLVVHCKNP